jgi:hypothetical protein
VTNLDITSAKLNIVLPAGGLPVVDPEDPRIVINMDGIKISAKVTAKAARKLGAHQGAAILQGRLMVERGELALLDAGFQFLDPRPATVEPPPAPKSI